MRESALMDFLSEGDTGAGGEWLPTSEKVIGSAQLAEPVTVPSVAPGSAGGPSPAAVGEAPSPFLSAPASRFEPPGAGTVLDSNGLRPPGFGPPRRTSADEGGPPVL
ncbi:MAG TPA: hypothetical protein VFH58_08575, partial [Acidimicrobiales bacterium]|nr:hypothetical protein [Acidimicrobiales bacterium]